MTVIEEFEVKVKIFKMWCKLCLKYASIPIRFLFLNVT